jgi:hypothetical protein
MDLAAKHNTPLILGLTGPTEIDVQDGLLVVNLWFQFALMAMLCSLFLISKNVIAFGSREFMAYGWPSYASCAASLCLK